MTLLRKSDLTGEGIASGSRPSRANDLSAERIDTDAPSSRSFVSQKMRTVCEAGPWHGSTLATPCPRCHRENARMVDTVFQRLYCFGCELLTYFDDLAEPSGQEESARPSAQKPQPHLTAGELGDGPVSSSHEDQGRSVDPIHEVEAGS